MPEQPEVSVKTDHPTEKTEENNQEIASQLTDAALVARVLSGEQCAFDILVYRYRQVVLQHAYALVHDWNRAEDIAQLTFIEAFTGLAGLHDTRRFRSWLMTIAHRCAIRILRNIPKNETEFSDVVLHPAGITAQQLVDDDMIERIRISLNELSVRNRAVITWHYLNGLSCGEIAARLELPVGTIKRILHESRNQLRVSCGIPSQVMKKGALVMSKTSHTLTSVEPRKLRWWVNGQSLNNSRLDTLLGQTIVLTINKKAKHLEQIAEEIQVHPQYVQETLDMLVKEEAVVKTSGDRYRDNFLAMDASDWMQVTAEHRRCGEAFADMLLARLPMLEDAWNRTILPSQGYGWELGCWITVGIFVKRWALMSAKTTPSLPAPLRPSGLKYWLGGYEDTPDTRWPMGAGFHTTGNLEDTMSYGYFIYYSEKRERVKSYEYSPLLTAIYHGIYQADAIAESACLPVEQVQESLAQMLESGIIERSNDSLRLTFPVFTSREDEILTPVVEEISSALSQTIVYPATRKLGECLTSAGYGYLKAQYPLWYEWMALMIIEEGVTAIVERNILPPMPIPAPANFALIGWFSPLRLV